MQSDDKQQLELPTASELEEMEEWLLSLDLLEPEDRLFKLLPSSSGSTQELTEAEMVLAGRPLTRDNQGKDDFLNYVGEEIVMSGDGSETQVNQKPNATDSFAAAMAVDNWHQQDGNDAMPEVDIPDGTDLFELDQCDDISNYRFTKRMTTVKAGDDMHEPMYSSMADDQLTARGQGFETEYTFADLDTTLIPPVEPEQESDLDLSLDLPGVSVESDETDVQAGHSEEAVVFSHDEVVSDLADAVAELSDDDVQATDVEASDADSDASDSVELGEQDYLIADLPQIEEQPLPEVSASDDTKEDVQEAIIPTAAELAALADSLAKEQEQSDRSEHEPFDDEQLLDLPSDDQAFDDYLTEADMPIPSEEELEDFALETDDTRPSLDVSDDQPIDYHDDLQELAANTAALVPAQEHLETLKNALLAQAQGGAAEGSDFKVELRIGADEETRASCAEQGFVPLNQIKIWDAMALLNLSQQTQDASFVRLIDGDGNTQNHYLSPELLVEQDSDTEDDAALSQDEVSTATEEPTEDVFGEDLLAEDLSDIEEPVAVSEQELNELLDSLAVDTSESQSDEICGVELREFVGVEIDGELPDLPVPTQPGADELYVAPAASADQWYLPSYITFSYSSASNNDVAEEFLEAFLEEGADELEKLEDQVVDWEHNFGSEEAYAPVTRTLHTLKGIAKGVGLQRYGTFIHNFETLLEQMKKPDSGAEQSYFRVVNVWLDTAVRGFEHILDFRTDISEELPSLSVEASEALEESADVDTAQSDEALAEPAVDTVERDDSSAEAISVDADSFAKTIREGKSTQDSPAADDGAKVAAAQQSVRITSERLDQLLNLTNQAQQLGVRSSQTLQRAKRSTAELQNTLISVRTHTSRIVSGTTQSLGDWKQRNDHTANLDALEMDQYTELQEAANILREGIEDLADLVNITNRQQMLVEALLKQQTTMISSMSSAVQSARVMPVSRLMPGLRRIVRTVSNDLGKSVTFRVLNEAGALDRDNYARCQIVLEHMVRNALDHGIEMPGDRLDAGKPTTGIISIDVRKEGGDYILSLADDGRGIDPEKMRDVVFEKGLDVDADALTDEQAMKMIFHKGFSTAASLSEISGRGVGMDIVLSELQKMGGDIDIHSEVGQGTRFDIRIPSNVTVNGALMVSAGDDAYAIPLDGLVAVEHIPSAEFFTAIEQGRPLQIYDMACEPSYLATLCHQDPMPGRNLWGHTVPIIVAGTPDRYLAVAVDDVQEALELAIRSLGVQFNDVPGLAGGATTADGAAIVALDLNQLVASLPELDQADGSAGGDRSQRPLVLVVDDSRTQRMVSTSHFDTVGVETVTAENGMVAIDLLNNTHRLPDIVLLDVEMPVKDGIQTLREIRKSSRYGHLPVIMVTSRTGPKHRALAEEAGCNGYMGKPFNFGQLIEQVNELTGLKLSTNN